MAHGEGAVTPITAEQGDAMIAALRQGVSAPAPKPTLKPNRARSKLGTTLRPASSPSLEDDENIARVRGALASISPDVKRGTGGMVDREGNPEPDYWLGVVAGKQRVGHE